MEGVVGDEVRRATPAGEEETWQGAGRPRGRCGELEAPAGLGRQLGEWGGWTPNPLSA